MPRSRVAAAAAAATLAALPASAPAAGPPMVIPEGTYQTTDSGGGTVSLMISGGQAIVGAAGSAGTPCVEPAPVHGPVFVTVCEKDLGYAGQTLIVSATLAGPTTLEGQTQLCTETYATRAGSCQGWNWSIELPPVPGYYTGKAPATGAPVAVFVSGSTVTVDAPGVPDICDPAPGTFSGPSSRFNVTCKGTLSASPGLLWVGGYEAQGPAALQGQSYVCATGVRCKTAIWTANWAGSAASSAAGARIAGTPGSGGFPALCPLGCSRAACRVTVVARDAAGRLGARHETLLRRGEKRTVKVRLTKPVRRALARDGRTHVWVMVATNGSRKVRGVTTRRVTLTRR